MNKATQFFLEAQSFAQTSIETPEGPDFDAKQAEAFKSASYDGADWPVWKQTVSASRAGFKRLATQKLPSEIAAERATKVPKK